MSITLLQWHVTDLPTSKAARKTDS